MSHTRHTFGTLRIPRGAGITDSGVVDGGVDQGEAMARGDYATELARRMLRGTMRQLDEAASDEAPGEGEGAGGEVGEVIAHPEKIWRTARFDPVPRP